MRTLRVPTEYIPLALQSLISGFQITMSLVVDVDGKTVNGNGNSEGIGNKTDLELLKACRRNAEVILTSGKTFRADKYKFPRDADLAILSQFTPEIEVPSGRRLLWLRSSYTEAIQNLFDSGYRRIHIEYGLSGLTALRANRSRVVLLISSVSRQGLEKFMVEQGLTGARFEIPELFLAVVAWH